MNRFQTTNDRNRNVRFHQHFLHLRLNTRDFTGKMFSQIILKKVSFFLLDTTTAPPVGQYTNKTYPSSLMLEQGHVIMKWKLLLIFNDSHDIISALISIIYSFSVQIE